MELMELAVTVAAAPYVRKEVRLVRPIHQGANHDR